jgi:hypothetical protein
MEIGRHFYTGEVLGNPNQPVGKHEYGTGFIPLGDRDRDTTEYGISFIEERGNNDPHVRYNRKSLPN